MFWASRSNFLDLFLAVMCSVIQLPPIQQAAFANWLTFFQLARFYRVIMVFPRMRPLIVSRAYSSIVMFFLIDPGGRIWQFDWSHEYDSLPALDGVSLRPCCCPDDPGRYGQYCQYEFQSSFQCIPSDVPGMH